MSKQAGMGMNFYIAGFDVSGDTNKIDQLGGGPKAWDTTDITQLANSRIGLQRDATIRWSSFFDTAAGAEHAALSGLPTADQIATCFVSPLAVGSPAASCVSKLVNADTSRPADGSLLTDYEVDANGFGLEWGFALTAGKRVDAAATNGASNNDGAATNFGAQAYLQVFAFTGTDVTIKIQDSADNLSFTDVAGFGFAQVTSAPQAQRIAIANNATLRQYVRAVTATVGGFTSVTFAIQYSRNPIAGVVF